MADERRRAQLRAFFAKLRAHQMDLRGVQRYIKGADQFVGGTEDLFKKKYPQTRAILRASSAVAGVPNQFIRAAASAERAATEVKKARALAEAQRQAAELLSKRAPFPAVGRGRPGPGTLIPPKEAGYKKWTQDGEHKGMWFPEETWEKMHKQVKRGRPPKLKKEHKEKIKKALKASAEAKKAMAAPVKEVVQAEPEKLRRVIEVGPITEKRGRKAKAPEKLRRVIDLEHMKD